MSYQVGLRAYRSYQCIDYLKTKSFAVFPNKLSVKYINQLSPMLYRKFNAVLNFSKKRVKKTMTGQENKTKVLTRNHSLFLEKQVQAIRNYQQCTLYGLVNNA
jgi:hypothetical protein